MGTFVLNWYEVLFNCACIKGNTDSLSCFWTEGFVSIDRFSNNETRIMINNFSLRGLILMKLKI